MSDATTKVGPSLGTEPEWTYRHSVVVRIVHWTTALSLLLLLMSGLQIFNAHPTLYWGHDSRPENAVLSMKAVNTGDRLAGITTVFGQPFATTGVLGVSAGADGPEERGFPAWATIPSWQDLATGRRWHFFFAWIFVFAGLVYVLHGLFSRHIQRDLVPTLAQIKHIGPSIREHLLLRFPKGEEAKTYNVLQKLAYLFVLAILFPLTVLGGFAMSPGLDAAFPWLLDLLGGRQTARTLHFVGATGIVLFVVVHLILVLVSGVWNNLRSMITGRYAIEREKVEDHV